MISERVEHSAIPIIYELDGQTYELLVVARSGYDNPVDYEMVLQLVALTIGNWARVWLLVHQDIGEVSEQHSQSACDKLEIMPSDDLPYVSVQNKDYNGLTLTVHSHTKPQHALDTIVALTGGIDEFIKLDSKMSYKTHPFKVEPAPPQKK